MNTIKLTAALLCTFAAACTLRVENGHSDLDWGVPLPGGDEAEDLEEWDEFDLGPDESTDTPQTPRPLDGYVRWERGDSNRWATGKGTVRFADDDQTVEFVGENAVVWIGEERRGLLREVHFLNSGRSTPRVIYEVDRVQQDWDASAREWFAQLLPDVVLHSEVGARDRAARILRTQGASELLTAFGALETPPVRAIYLDVLLSDTDDHSAGLAVALGNCSGELAGSGTQYSIYQRLADRYAEAEALQFALIACAERTKLPQDRFDSLRALLSVWKRGALVNPALETRWIEASAVTVPRLHAELLLEYVAYAPAGDRSQIAALHAARALTSSVLQSDVIERCAKRTPASEQLLLEVVQEIDGLESVSRRESLLTQLLDREDLAPTVLDAIGDAAEGLGSPAAERRVLERLSIVRADA